MDQAFKDRVCAEGPVGWWRSSAGSADALGVSDVVFGADGSGSLVERSVLSGQSTTAFRWRVAAPGVLGLSTEPAPDPLDAEAWWLAPLAFTVQHTDTGSVPVMHQARSDGFWVLLHPLRWVGAAPEATSDL